MRVDSFAFLPRSFRPLFEKAPRLPGHEAPVWAPFEKRLAEAKVGLLSSAGLYVKAVQPPFDGERERREPTWGDPSWSAIPAGATTAELGSLGDGLPAGRPRGLAQRDRARDRGDAARGRRRRGGARAGLTGLLQERARAGA
jgi:hypothetical protein